MASSASDSTTLDSSSPNDNNNKLYKGVRLRKWGKWVSEVRLPNSRERIWLGSYDSPVKAARAFDAALYCLRGRHANFNFPDTPSNLENNNVVFSAGDKSLTPQEIQEIASKFANEDPPPRFDGGGGGGSISTSTTIVPTTTTTATTNVTSSCSTNISECDGMQVDHEGMSKMDWSFLDMLDHDYSNEVPVCSDYYGLYSDLDKVHSGDFVYSNLLPPPFEDNEQQIEGDGDPFSHQPKLWNW